VKLQCPLYRRTFFLVFFFIFGLLLINSKNSYSQTLEIKLPKAKLDEGKALSNTLQERKSIRSFSANKKLDLQQISQLLWAANGTKVDSLDTVTSATQILPSAGGVYALKIYLIVGENSVEELPKGIYFYSNQNNTLQLLQSTDARKELAQACLGQNFIAQAPVSIAIAAEFNRMRQRYNIRANQYVYFEVGHAAQNIHLMCEDLELATVEVGAFTDKDVNKVIGINYPVLLIMPVGYER